MSQRTLSSSLSTLPWVLDPILYDRFPELREPERAELSRLFSSGKIPIGKASKHILQRLLQPIQEVLAHLQAPTVTCGAIGRILCLEMHRRGTPFWAWSVEEWRESLGPNNAAFGSNYGWQAHTSQSIRARSYLPGLVYILSPELNMQPLLDVIEIAPLAQKLFGKELILQTVRRITTVLESWGYQPEADFQHFTACICYLLLVNRSPYLEDLSYELLEAAGQRCTISSVKHHIGKVSRALFALGITTRPLSESRQIERREAPETDEHISGEWRSWCQRWQKHSTHQHTYSTYYPLLEVGRWLFVHHPEITSPEQWTYELAAEFVAAVNTMKVGEWSAPDGSLSKYKKRFGQPLRPSSKARILGAMRIFLRDCQEWNWIPVRVNPSRAFRTPPSIQNQLGPDPRVIDRDQWAKLLWAAMNLQMKDLLLLKIALPSGWAQATSAGCNVT